MNDGLQSTALEELCDFYLFDSNETVDELQNFSFVYKASHHNIDISDLVPKLKNSSIPKNDKEDTNNEEEMDYEEEDNSDNTTTTVELWLKRGFIKPYRCLQQLSGFPNLNGLYKILLSLSVTSCSAERAMSRIKIVKNRLRTSMSDTWMNNLLILSSEVDILNQLSYNEIIDQFAITTKNRQKLLSKG